VKSPGARRPRGSEDRHGAEAPGLELAGQLRRNEAGFLDRLAAAAIEDRDALGIGRLDPTGIDKDRQPADFAWGEK
jgi:hypothetical protein